MLKFKRKRKLAVQVCKGLFSASWEEETEMEACEASEGQIVEGTFVELDQEQQILDRSNDDTALPMPSPKKPSK